MKRLFPAFALLVGACATAPTGPNVMVLPGSGKSFEQFQAEDAACRQWAAQQTESAQAATPPQHRYDMSYMQCMYARGNQLPAARNPQPPQAQSGPPPTSSTAVPDLRGTWTGTWAGTPLTLFVLNQEVVLVPGINIGPWFAQQGLGLTGILTYTVRDAAVSVNVRGQFGFSNGVRTLYLDPQSGYGHGQQITLTRVEPDRMGGVGTSRVSWEPSGPVELTRQPDRR